MLRSFFHDLYRNLFEIKIPLSQEVTSGVEVPGAGTAPEGSEGAPETSEKEEDWTSGTRADYEKYLTENTDFALTAILKSVRDRGERAPFENYAKEWIQYPTKAAAFIRETWPRKPGLKQFVEGLEATPKLEDGTTDPEFKESFQMLQRLVRLLQDRDKHLHVAREKREVLAHHEGTVSETVKNGVSNFVRNFREGSATDKIATVAIVAVVLKTLQWLNKQKLPGSEKYTFGSLMKLAVVGWAINAASAKMSKDGKTLLQRLDVGTPVENVRNTLWSIFSLDGDQEGKQLTKPNEHRTMFAFATKNIKPIAERYREYTASNRNRFTEQDLATMGFSPQEARSFDGEVAFHIVDKLFRRAGKNYFPKIQIDEARKRNLKPEDVTIETIGSTFEELGHMAIDQKYIHGKLSGRAWSFEQVMVEEMLEWAEVEGGVEALEKQLYAGYDKSKLTSQVAEVISEAGTSIQEGVTKSAKWIGKKAWFLGGTIAEGFKSAYDVADRKIQQFRGIHKQDEYLLQSALKGAEYGVTIEVLAPGRVRVMGYPTSYTKTESEDKIVYTIEGIPISPMLMDTHEASKKDLSKAIRERVIDLAKASPLEGSDKLKFDKIKFDQSEKVWYLDGIKVKGVPKLGIDNTPERLVIRFDDEGRVHFEMRNEEITSMKEIDQQYQHAVIVQKLRKAAPFLDYVAVKNEADKKLRITIAAVEDTLGGGMVVTGDIEGARFTARKKGNELEFFFKDTKKETVGLEAVKIDNEFRKAKLDQIASSRLFHEAFENAQVAVEASPNIDSDAKAYWKYLMEFKRAEVLAFYKDDLDNAKTLADAQKAQENFIQTRLTEISNFVNSFNSNTDPAAQKKFFKDKNEEWEGWLYKDKDWLPTYKDLMHQVQKGKYKIGSRLSTTPFVKEIMERDDQKVLNIVRNAWSIHIRRGEDPGDVKNRILSRLDRAMVTGIETGLEPGVVSSSDDVLENPEKW